MSRPLSWLRGIARRFGAAALPSERREFILGDLEELHESMVERAGRGAADRRYLRDLFGSVTAHWFGRAAEPGQARGHGGGGGRDGRGRWRLAFGADLVTELRQAARALGRQPGFVLVVAATLGVGVGAAGAVFGMVNQLLLRPLPGIVDPGGAAFLEFSTPDRGMAGVSNPLVAELRESASLLDGFATEDYVGVHASTEGGRPLQVRAFTVFGDYFELLGVRPAAGRLLTAAETGRHADPYRAVISERLWEALFARSADVVGRSFQANGQTFTVLGVAGGGFRGLNRSWAADMWVPRSAYVPLNPGSSPDWLWSRSTGLNQDFVVRPRPGVTLQAVETELNSILSTLAESEAWDADAEDLTTLDATLHAGLNVPVVYRPLVLPALAILGLGGMLILLIPCANVANLLLMRTINARGDVAVRRALGASTASLARGALIESLLLATVGTLAGLGVAWLIGTTVRGEALWGMPGFDGFVVDWKVLVFAGAAVLVTAVMSGTIPAVLSARFDPADALRDATRQSTGRHGVLRHGISIVQIALSLTLLVGSVLLVRTVRNVYAVDDRLEVEGVYIASIDLGRHEMADADLAALRQSLLQRVADVDGVDAAAVQAFYGPYSGGGMPITVAASADPESRPPASVARHVSPGWFELFEIDAVAGRLFRTGDMQSTTRPPVILSAALANRLFQQTNVVGRTVWTGIRTLEEAEVVGVVGDLRMVDLRQPPGEAIFLPHPLGQTTPITVLARVRGADAGTPARLELALEAAAPAFPVPEPEALSTRIDNQLAEQRILARLLGVFSGLAVLLAAVGLYGVVAFGVAGRRREFAIRLAIGADARRIARLVLRSAAIVVGAGTAVGLVGAYGLSSVIESRLYGVEAMDPGSYMLAAALLGTVAVAACWLPARTAARVDPAATLRQE